MKSRLLTNATSSVIQTVLSGVVLFFLYRFLLGCLGPEKLGIWALLLATTSISRLSELGIAGSVIPFVSRSLARGDLPGAISVIETAVLTTIGATPLLLLLAYPLIRFVLGLVLSVAEFPIATSVLPFALFSLLISVTAGVYQSALDAAQRLDLRALSTTLGNVTLLLAAFILAPRLGLLGATLAQASQAFVTLLLSVFLVRREIPALPLVPRHWSLNRFRESLSYGANLQAATLLGFLYEPITKLLLSHFSGVATVAYYEMANRLVQQVRALVVSAGQAITPLASRLPETAPAEISHVYQRSCGLLVGVAIPIYSTLIGLLPVTMWLWVGRDQPQFFFAGVVLSIASFINVLTVPSYFFNMGLGRLRWNTISHLVIGMLNVGLGWSLGTLYAARGVVLSSAVALATGSLVLVVSFHRAHAISRRVLLFGTLRTVPLAVLGVCAQWLSFHRLHGRLPLVQLLALELAGGGALFALIAYLHPSVRALLTKLGSRA